MVPTSDVHIERDGQWQEFAEKGDLSLQNQSFYNVAEAQQAVSAVKPGENVIFDERAIPEPLLPQNDIGSPERNYILSQSILTPITDETMIGSLADKDLQQTISYYDGLGRPTQSIGIKGSPLKKDIITPVTYDELGLQTLSYLPYVTDWDNGQYQENALVEQRFFYLTQPQIPQTFYPSAETVHETSPLLRVQEQGNAGEPWQPAGRTPIGGHTIKTSYATNESDEVRLWKWNQAAGRFQADEFYGSGQLMVTEIEDENGHVLVEYRDKLDRVILKRAFNRDKISLIPFDTYYIYDDFGDLRYIVPPKAVFAMPGRRQWFIDRLSDSKWVTEFIYDGYHRVVEKRVPGAAPVYTIYDRLGRPILTQDGQLRQVQRWLFTKYDMLGRPVLTGIYRQEGPWTRTAMQTYVDAYFDNPNAFYYEQRIEAGGSSFSMDFDYSQGYSDQAFPSLAGSAFQVLEVTYYDDYDFNNNGRANDDYSFTPDAEFPDNEAFYRLKNKVTGRRIKILKNGTSAADLPDWITTVYFYDKYGRVIQTYARDHKGITIADTQYDFSGKVAGDNYNYPVMTIRNAH